MLCGAIILGIVVYYYFIKNKKNKKDKKSEDVTISLPKEETTQNSFNLPLPTDPNQNLGLSEDQYINLMQQQMQQQQMQQQQQQMQQQPTMPQIIHPNQMATDDNESQSQEPSLTAKEIENI